MSGYPVAEIIDADRLREVLARSVVRAKAAREEYRVAFREQRDACGCWMADEMCDDCWNF